MFSRAIHSVSLALTLTCFSVGLAANDKHAERPVQDQIRVIAHIPTDGNIVRFLTTQHYRRNYLYAEHQSGSAVTLIDITNKSHPSLLADMSNPAGGPDNLVAVAGDAALAEMLNQQSSSPAPHTFRILSFADRLHPMVEQEFKGVTAMARDEKRGLIFLANSDGIWILQQELAPDPEAEKEWEHMMLDAR